MTLALIAFAVAMDCTAVSAAYALRRVSRADLATLAITFGTFQAVTTLFGAFGGTALASWFGQWDGWIAFILLLAVGSHMIHEAISEDHDEEADRPDLPLVAILALGMATSIDSLAVGATIPTLGLSITVSTVVIGIVSLAMSFVGAWAGRRLGERFGPSVEILGGVVLIAIGLRALWLELLENTR